MGEGGYLTKESAREKRSPSQCLSAAHCDRPIMRPNWFSTAQQNAVFVVKEAVSKEQSSSLPASRHRSPGSVISVAGPRGAHHLVTPFDAPNAQTAGASSRPQGQSNRCAGVLPGLRTGNIFFFGSLFRFWCNGITGKQVVRRQGPLDLLFQGCS